jgi:hypothetical protein
MNKFLEDKILILKPNPRGGGMIKNKTHIGYFRYNGTNESFMLPRDDRSGGLMEIFESEEERAFFAKSLGRKPEELNVRAKDNYFYSYQVKILKDESFMQAGVQFDLSDVVDMLKYKILLKSNRVAPTFDTRYDKGTYVYYFIEKDFKDKSDLSRINLNAEVWKRYNSMENSIDKMYEFLYLYWLKNKGAIKPNQNPTMDYCKIHINRIIEDDKKGFMDVFNSPSLKDEVMIYKAVESGLIDYDGKIFLNFEGQQVGKTLNDVIYFYNDSRNSAEKLKLRASLKEKVKDEKKIKK